MSADLSLIAAFGAGVLSFISPCCLPLYPAFLSYITGVSVDELTYERGILQRRALLHTAFFLIGFSLIFVFLGLSTTFVGHWYAQYRDAIRQIGAIFIFIFGLVLAGWIQPKFLLKNRRISFKQRPPGYVGSALIGTGYAAGWTPCTGPILAAVLALAAARPELGIWYMLVYVLGFAIPFFVMSFFLGKLKMVKKYSLAFMKAGGVAMIVMSVFLYFDWMAKLTAFLVNRVFGGFQGF